MSPATEWTHIKFSRIAYLVDDAPPAQRWHWHVCTAGKNRKRMQLIDPAGAVYDFKMAGGTFIRLVVKKEPPPTPPENPTETQTQIGLTHSEPRFDHAR